MALISHFYFFSIVVRKNKYSKIFKKIYKYTDIYLDYVEKVCIIMSV